jgi:hypothetical protein
MIATAVIGLETLAMLQPVSIVHGCDGLRRSKGERARPAAPLSVMRPSRATAKA